MSRIGRITFRSVAIATILILPGLGVSGSPQGVADLRTRAERTDYMETTRYDEVVEFVDAVAAASPLLHATTFGYSYEGRPLPMVVFGDVVDASPEEVRATGKTRVWIQGNIHAGEVCGKEALLMLLRDLAQGGHAGWIDTTVLLIAPIYNADGNERFQVGHRGSQNGPVGGMGQRPNAQGLDLNRDHMKLESAEARSLVRMMNDYDPHLGVDLHTTNGTHHGYHVTYSPPLHPNTPVAIDELLRGDWLPTVTRRIKEKHGWDYYYYGNASGFGGGRRGGAPGRGRGGPAGRGTATAGGGRAGAGGGRTPTTGGGPPGQTQEPAWRTFDHRPRFNNNYMGLRNRFAILSEAYAYASFEERVLASLYFVEEIVDYVHEHGDQIRDTVTRVDAESVVGTTLAVRAEPQRSDEPVEILMGETERVLDTYSGRMITKRLDVPSTPVAMYEYGTFAPTDTETVPAVYYVPPELQNVIANLTFHGVATGTLAEETTLAVEQFVVGESTQAPREFQGHQERRLEGSWEATERTLPAGTVVVQLDQPLGRLAFSLLEPRSDDGLTDWNFVDQALSGSETYPIVRAAQVSEAR